MRDRKKKISKIERRALALLLCGLLVLDSSILTLAEEENGSEEQVSSEDSFLIEEEAPPTESSATGEALSETSSKPEITPESVIIYEDENIIISVNPVDAQLIPEGVTLKVIPLLQEDAEYAAVETELHNAMEKELLGFLAYDISLVDAEGNEMEPRGEVKIQMSYKQAMLPAALSSETASEAEVTVMHLEENPQGEIVQVVDMKGNAQLENLQISDANGIELAEFKTVAFSVFTIVWAKEVSLTAYCVDEGGTALSDHAVEIGKIQIDEALLFHTWAAELGITELGDDDYIFIKAYLKNQQGNVVDHVKKIRYIKGQWQYSLREDRENWVNIGSYKLYLQYWKKDSQKPQMLPTADTSGLNISLFNYTGETNGDLKTATPHPYENGFYFLGRNGADWGRSLAGESGFVVHPADSRGGKYTLGWDSTGFAYQDLVTYNLANGFPVLNANYNYGDYFNAWGEVVNTSQKKPTASSGISLDYLFGGVENVVGVTPYTDLTGLFQMDQDGYYYYDSNYNHAQLNESTRHIDVYDGTLVHMANAANEDRRGQFLPFDNIDDHNSVLSDQHGTIYSYDIPGTQEDAFDKSKTLGDLWFGMKVDAYFYQPKGGMWNNEEVVFQFSGDDDMWTYIDGIKVLDIGGIHEELSGYINFATGEVKVNHFSDDKKSFRSTMYECFKKAYEELGHDPKEVKELLAEKFEEIKNDKGLGTGKYRFKNFSAHTMNVFYLERGASFSNCRMKFNLLVPGKDTVIVEKEISNYEPEKFSDIEFTFQMHTAPAPENGQKPAPGDYTEYAEKSYVLNTFDKEGKPVKLTKTTDAQGCFTLKHGEQAVFEGIRQGTKYYVTELDVNSKEYDKVTIAGIDIINEEEVPIQSDVSNFRSDYLTVGENPVVHFENSCDVDNLKQIVIQKTLADAERYQLPREEACLLYVEVAGAPYSGKYQVGTSEAEARASLTEFPTDNGYLTLKQGETAVLLGYVVMEEQGQHYRGFPSGTSFEVTEALTANVTAERYLDPVYHVTDAAKVQSVDGFAGTGYGKGELLQNRDSGKVTVINSLRYGDLVIEKHLKTYNQTLGEATFLFEVTARWKEEEIYSNVIPVSFDAHGVQTCELDTDFPVGTAVKIEEVYSGAAYNPMGNVVQELVMAAGENRAVFANDYAEGRLNSGSAVVNTIRNDQIWEREKNPK